MAESAPQQDEVRNSRNNNADTKQETVKELKREFKWVEGVTIATNVILAVVGIFALKAYYGQLDAMNGQLTQMVASGKQTDQTLDLLRQQLGRLTQQAQDTHTLALAASDQATAALGNFKINQGNLRNWQRPYVWANLQWFPPDQGRVATLRPYGQDFYAIMVHVEVRNSGATPATEVIATKPFIINNQAAEATATAQSFFLEGKKGEPATAEFILAPNSFQSLNPATPEIMAKADYDRLMTGNRLLYIYGRIVYRDIFKPAKPHYITNYCFVYTPNRFMEFENCSFGNSID